MRCSIIITTRNRGELLAHGLLALAEHEYIDVETIVIDDGSIDSETPTILERYHESIHVHRIDRMGGYRENPAHVLNVGHALAKADIHLEQNAEVCHITDCVTPLLEVCRPGLVALARVHNGGMVDYMRVVTAVRDKRYSFPEDVIPKAVPFEASHLVVPRVHPGSPGTQLYCGIERPVPFFFCAAIHKKDFNFVGGYDESATCNNDGNLAERLWKSGVRFCFVGNAVAFHLQHGKT